MGGPLHTVFALQFIYHRPSVDECEYYSNIVLDIAWAMAQGVRSNLQIAPQRVCGKCKNSAIGHEIVLHERIEGYRNPGSMFSYRETFRCFRDVIYAFCTCLRTLELIHFYFLTNVHPNQTALSVTPHSRRSYALPALPQSHSGL